MKEPKMAGLKIDVAETLRIRKMAAKAKTIKITVNLDAESLAKLKRSAEKTGVPYQRLLNQVLKDGLGEHESASERITRLERDVAKMKKKLAA